MSVTQSETIPPVFVEIEAMRNVIGLVSPDASVIDIITSTTLVPIGVVPPVQYLEIVDDVIRGAPGPPGPAGLVKIPHGNDPNVARPDVPLVYWVGSVTPVHADPDDLLMLKS